MKKLSALTAVLAVVLSIFTTTLLATEPIANASDQMKVIYLDSTSGKGSDSNSGTSTEDPVVSMVRAFQLLGDEGGIVCLSGDTVIDDPNYTQDCRNVSGWQIECFYHTGKIYVTSINGARLIKNNGDMGTTFSLGGPVEFFNITVENRQDQNLNFYAYGHELVMGNGIVYVSTVENTSKGWHIYGYTANNEQGAGADMNPNVSIYSGTYLSVNGAGTASAGAVRGDSTINIYGGNIANVRAGGAGGLNGNQIFNFYNDTIPRSVSDREVTGSITCNIYNYSTGAMAGTMNNLAQKYTVNKLTGPTPIPDSDFLAFRINDLLSREQTEAQDAVTEPMSDAVDPDVTAPTHDTENFEESGCGAVIANGLVPFVTATLIGILVLRTHRRIDFLPPSQDQKQTDFAYRF